jgi:diacylglycerol kinase family enzyme
MSSWFAIVNPSSGARSPRAVERCLESLRRWTNRVVLTERRGHATELAREASGEEGIVVVGGDGTLFEVLQGLDRARHAVCLIPTGRGNSLARDLGLQAPLEHGPVSFDELHIDLLQVTSRTGAGRSSTVLSASTVAIGYATDVARVASERLRSLRALSYPVASVCVAPRRREVRIACAHEAPVEHALTGVIASNTRHAASFVVFPEADCSDGTFEALELAHGRIGQWLHNASALTRVPLVAPRARTGLESLRLDLREPHDVLVDGEIHAGIVSVDVQILPKALKLARIRRPR